MTVRSHDWLLCGQIALIERGRRLVRCLRDRGDSSVRNERGQTATEYLMIVGLMAAVIVIVFVTFYWNTVKSVAWDWYIKVYSAVAGHYVFAGP